MTVKYITKPEHLVESCKILSDIFKLHDHNKWGNAWWFHPVRMDHCLERLTKLFFDPPDLEISMIGAYTGNAVAIGGVWPHFLTPETKWAEEFICRSNGKDGTLVRDHFVKLAKAKGANAIITDGVIQCGLPPDQEWRDRKMNEIGYMPWATRYIQHV